MSKKTVLAVAAMVILAAVSCLIAEKTDNGPDVVQTQRQRKPTDTLDGDTLAGQERPPIPNSEQEKRILSVLEDMCRDQHSGILSVPPEDGRVLRLLTEATGAKHVVEIGTSNGYAAIWFCLALRTTGGKLTTYEIDTRRALLARENFKRAGVDKLVTLIEGDAHKAVKRLKEPIDIVFIDADKDGYLDYLNKLLPLVRPGGLILAHNTTDVGSQMQGYLRA
ncbi:MAG: class I SAM-dependent methyltransferase, partial [Phycisphaerales bacterium]